MENSMSDQPSIMKFMVQKASAVDLDAPPGKLDREERAKPTRFCRHKHKTGHRCGKPFLASLGGTRCPFCLARRCRNRNSKAGKDSKQRYQISGKGKKGAAVARKTVVGRANQKRNKISKAGRASQKRSRTNPAGRERKKRQNASRMSALEKSLIKMVRGVHPNPKTFRELGLFADNADAEAFFESTKTEPWMKGAPWGKKEATTLPETVLQIGHKIPKSWYRHDDEAEIKKAWSRTNLFAQCVVENIRAGDRNQLTEEQWMALKEIWPKQCANMTDEEAWIWARDNVDNATRKKKRKRSNPEAAATSQYVSE